MRSAVVRFRASLAGITMPGWIVMAFTVLGLVLRVEHALTFDGPRRGSDYAVHLQGVRWMMDHWRPFNFDPAVNWQVRSYPPLWYAVSAVILKLTGTERAIAALAVLGWGVRHFLLARMLREMVPQGRWSVCAALCLHAVLPLSVLIDGKVNPEGLQAALVMVAVYFLWRMERQTTEPAGIALGTAVAFGISAGLALLTKATASVVVASAFLVLVFRAARLFGDVGWAAAWRRVLRPALVSALVWWAVVGAWCGPNLLKYGHPFPHGWDLQGQDEYAELREPTLYRRPAGWVLPFEWRESLEFPVLQGPSEPRPNFWAAQVAGTWSDWYNRGFCRLKGGPVSHHVWGGIHGHIPENESWALSWRCVRLLSALVHVGLWITTIAVVALLYAAWSHLRSGAVRGTLALPVMTVLATSFTLLFALVYPFDHMAVLNPRYLLPQVTPMSVCFGFGLGRLEELEQQRGGSGGIAALVIRVTLGAIAVTTALLVYERFGG